MSVQFVPELAHTRLPVRAYSFLILRNVHAFVCAVITACLTAHALISEFARACVRMHVRKHVRTHTYLSVQVRMRVVARQRSFAQKR